VAILLQGKHSRRGDADNIAGAILDALVQAGVLKDDSLIHVKGLAVALEWSKKLEPESTVVLEV
jgi:Holliday junction resolvase RusA-like endonuclease